MDEREAYLKPEYGESYPGLPAGRWIGAFAARHLVHFLLAEREHEIRRGERVLASDHFLFRGGETTDRKSGEERRRPVRRFRPSKPSAVPWEESRELE